MTTAPTAADSVPALANARRLRHPVGWLYLATFISVGLSLTMIGPSLTYLRERAGVTKGEIGVLFPASSIGYLAGSLISGRLYDRGFGHRAVAGGLIGLAASSLLVPHVTTIAALSVVFAAIGAFSGCVDVGGNTLVVWHTRGTGSSRLLNALHLFFGFGALASPLLVSRSIAWTGGLGLAVGALAAYSLIIAVVVLLHETPIHTAHIGHGDAVEAPTNQTPARVLGVIGIFFFLYVGVEIGFSGWLTTYAEGIELPGKDSPTWLNTLFFVCFTIGRFVAVLVARRIRPGLMLVGSCAATSVLLLAMAIADGSPAAVWITTGLIGLAVAPQFATMIAYAEEHIKLSGRATSWFVSAAGFGGIAMPFLIGRLLDRSSNAMPIAVFCGAIAATGWVAVVRRSLIVHRRTPAAA